MGIERIEPAVPRKDVERKIYALRKEQIRNTALRFRFQMILQRYSTFQSHWQRICREIENGTYKRQLRHSERKRAPAPEAVPQIVATPEAEAPPTVPSPEPTRPGLGEALSVAAAPPPRGPLPAPGALPSRAPPPAPGALPSRGPLPAPGALPSRAPLPAPGATPPRDLAAELEELDKEFAPATPRGVGPPVPTRVPAIPPTRPGHPATPRQPQSPPALSRPPPLAPLGRPTTAGHAPGTTAGHAPAATAPPGHAQAAATPRVLPATPSAPGKVAPAAATAPPRRDGGLPEYRVRQLYVEYVDAKRRQKESTASLTYEALAESLRASSRKLREKHGKPVDFEVGLKDGKAVLRPKLK